ncbi:lasso RiPP family leader peptide-containing protein [Amycolatopsis silviterrae]|uniref:Lasso RiPP family leader peptide-containing protein n=1 Tax=Amycolatopsis silviterrae TaxID=1656914 RepID=A0ABW5H852_9PSEU
MEKDLFVYAPPTVVEAGRFAEITLGLPYYGFELDGRCLFNCAI